MEGGVNKFISAEEETAALLRFSPNVNVVMEAGVFLKNCLSLPPLESTATVLISLEDIV